MESTKEDYKEEVARVKKEEIAKWAKLAEFARESLRGNKGKEMESVLNQIIIQSEENLKCL